MVNKEHYLTETEANQNISKAEMMAKRKKPKAMPVNPVIEMTDDEKIDFVARRILNKYRAAFEELAQ